jgi:hypothetical protein
MLLYIVVKFDSYLICNSFIYNRCVSIFLSIPKYNKLKQLKDRYNKLKQLKDLYNKLKQLKDRYNKLKQLKEKKASCL